MQTCVVDRLICYLVKQIVFVNMSVPSEVVADVPLCDGRVTLGKTRQNRVSATFRAGTQTQLTQSEDRVLTITDINNRTGILVARPRE
jgi:hypothetical protein